MQASISSPRQGGRPVRAPFRGSSRLLSCFYSIKDCVTSGNHKQILHYYCTLAWAISLEAISDYVAIHIFEQSVSRPHVASKVAFKGALVQDLFAPTPEPKRTF